MFPRRGSSRPLGRLLRDKAVAFPVIFSLLVHAGLIAALVSWRMEAPKRVERLSETGSSTVLSLATERPPAAMPEPRTEPKPEPPPAPPRPVAEPEPKEQERAVPSAIVEAAPLAKDAIVIAPAASKPSQAPAPMPKPVEPPPPEATPAAETKVAFAGVESKRANKIVYAIDASGSMASSLPFVKAELARSVAKLDASQSFAVVVFREKLGGGESVETFASGNVLLAATPRAKADLARWVATVEPSGRSSPVAGLRTAMGYKPDLVLLLTRNIRRSGRGEAEGNASVLASINAINPVAGAAGQRGVVVKVVQFVEEDPTGLMQAIGEAHGDGPGSYRVVPVE